MILQLIDLSPGINKIFLLKKPIDQKEFLDNRIWSIVSNNFRNIKSTSISNRSNDFNVISSLLIEEKFDKTNFFRLGRYNREEASIYRSELYKDLIEKNIDNDTAYIVDNFDHLRHLKYIFRDSAHGFFKSNGIWLILPGQRHLMTLDDKKNLDTINYKKVQLNKKISIKRNNIDGEFQPLQAGGKIINFDDGHILLSVGEYRNRFLAQDKKSVNGKIIKINIFNSDYEVISMGHRNPQGLYFDKENNFILETEHGPYGGDEINLIEVEKINKDKIQNYGWAIVSGGEHYGGKNDANKQKYKKYPLYKSHSKYGFIEPLKMFIPSIGIGEIIKIRKNRYVVASLKDASLYFFELSNEKKIINLERVEVFERIRSLLFKDNKIYLFLEDTPSIGVISLN